MLINALTQQTDLINDSIWLILYLVWLLGSTLFLLSHRARPVTTLAWLLTFWTLPLLSAIGYFLFGPRRLDDERRLRQTARKAAFDATPDVEVELDERFRSATPWHRLARVTRASGEPSLAPARADSLTLYLDGNEAYPALLDAFRSARDTLHLEYYIWQPDTIGTRLRDALVERAAAGIKVRLVLDAMGAKNCDRDFWQPLLSAGGDVRRFNPPHPFKAQPGKINFRTHRKIVVIDGKLAFTGGINVSDNNVDQDDGQRAWRNTHLRLEGPPVAGLQKIFLEDWIYAVPIDHDKSALKQLLELLPGFSDDPSTPDDVDTWFPDYRDADGPWVQIVDSGPDEPTNDIHRLFFAAIASARERLWITTPYFVPDDAIETALLDATARGVDVKLLVPENSDSRMVAAASKTYFDELMNEGAEIWQFGPHMVHTKTLVIDDSFAIVGTANMDNRSFRLNFEVVVAIFDDALTRKLIEHFERDLESSRRYTETEADRRLPQRIYLNAMRLLSPLL